MLDSVRRDVHELALAMSRGQPSAASKAAALRQDSFLILALWRARCAARRLRIPLVNHILRRAQTLVFGIELGNDIELGPGVFFVHPVGIVVGGTACVGARVVLMGSNTVGTAKDNGCPVIEDDVIVGAGARVLGPVRVGARAVIGANAVVLDDVPADRVVVGIPARVVEGVSSTARRPAD